MEGSKMEREEIEKLISQLKSKDPIARLRAVASISLIQDYKIVDPLIEVAISDTDSDVRYNAINHVVNLKTMINNLILSNPSMAAIAEKSLQKIDRIIEKETSRTIEADKKKFRKKEQMENINIQRFKIADSEIARRIKSVNQGLISKILQGQNIEKELGSSAPLAIVAALISHKPLNKGKKASIYLCRDKFLFGKILYGDHEGLAESFGLKLDAFSGDVFRKFKYFHDPFGSKMRISIEYVDYHNKYLNGNYIGVGIYENIIMDIRDSASYVIGVKQKCLLDIYNDLLLSLDNGMVDIKRDLAL